MGKFQQERIAKSSFNTCLEWSEFGENNLDLLVMFLIQGLAGLCRKASYGHEESPTLSYHCSITHNVRVRVRVRASKSCLVKAGLLPESGR
jgi:hypothetical protein